jgi:anti-anti-sigma regulatory factor
MVNVSYDHEHNTVIVEFKGNIDAAQSEQFFSDIEQVLPKDGKGFKLLVDFSSVEAMDLAVQRGIKKAMELFNARGVTEVLRVLPDPDMDIGFNMMSMFRYSKDVRIHTLRSREAARLKIEESSLN